MVWAPASSSAAGGLPAVKAGASLTGVTVIVEVRAAGASAPALGGPPLSRPGTVYFFQATAPAGGLPLSLPAALPLGGAANRPGFLALPTGYARTAWPDSLAGPGPKAAQLGMV